MDTSRLLFFTFFAILIQLVMFASAQRDPSVFHECSKVTSNSTYKANLNSLLSSLSFRNQTGYGFYNFSVGENSDKVNSIALCRGDLTPDDCRNCVQTSSQDLLFWCPNKTEGIIWYMNCTLRYSNNSIFGIMDVEPVKSLLSNESVEEQTEIFKQTRRTLLERLRSEAASGGSLRKLAFGNSSSTYISMYALLQCTPDLEEKECSNCLNWTIGYIPTCCDVDRGARVLTPSCNLRYQKDRFYTTSSSPPSSIPTNASPPSSSPRLSAGGKENNSSRTAIIVVAALVFVVIIVCACVCIYLRVRKQRKNVKMDKIIDVEALEINLDAIKVATQNFSDANKIGSGGFGTVFKGRLSNGQEIAIKRLASGSQQGDEEFKNEVLLMSKLHHRNLVRLLGFCLEGDERLLIYELMPNSSLDLFIFDPIKRLLLDWESCKKIIVGIARGLLYLHEDSQFGIIHRDLKASNILLDLEMNPKIADFGMARLFMRDQTHGSTKRIVGTYGYMAPEYAAYGRFSVKSDVFSFGILILEIISGQKNGQFHVGENIENLLSYAWISWREGRASNFIDPILITDSTMDIVRCMHIALLCIQEKVANRPTMGSVVLMLNSRSITLSVPSRPGHFMHSNVESDISLDQSFQTSRNEASMTELYPR